MGDLLRNRSRQATFLCYHSVGPAGPKYLTVDVGLFEHQLDQLAGRGLRGGGRAELEAAAAGQLAEPTVFLTFDDGFRDNYGTVLPLLRERGIPAFVFVLPSLVDDGGALYWPEVAADQGEFSEAMRSLDWRMAEEMKEAGFEIGSHTLSHPHLPELSGEPLREELLDSRRRIAERLGECDLLAYPFGAWSEEVEAAAGECGYRFAFTLPTKVGQRRATPLSIPRINIDYRDRGARFRAKLSATGKRVYLSTSVGAARKAVGDS